MLTWHERMHWCALLRSKLQSACPCADRLEDVHGCTSFGCACSREHCYFVRDQSEAILVPSLGSGARRVPESAIVLAQRALRAMHCSAGKTRLSKRVQYAALWLA